MQETQSYVGGKIKDPWKYISLSLCLSIHLSIQSFAKASKSTGNGIAGKFLLLHKIYLTFECAFVCWSAGFQVTGMACCATGTFEMSYLCNEHSITCRDANKYVFWDAFHPTEKTNQIISQKLIPILLAEFQWSINGFRQSSYSSVRYCNVMTKMMWWRI